MEYLSWWVCHTTALITGMCGGVRDGEAEMGNVDTMYL